MISIFKTYLGWLVAGECVFFAIASAMTYDGMALWLAVLVFAGLSLTLYLVLEFISALAHQRLLGVFYTWQRPRDFIRLYEPLCQQKQLRKNVKFTMLAYLSNAYCAAGDFKKALAILEDMPSLSRSRQPEVRTILAGNRCSIHLYQGNGDAAREQYLNMLEGMTSLSGKKLLQNQASAQLLAHRLDLARGEVTEETADYIRGRLHGRQSAYYMTELNYSLGLVYLALGNEAFAREYLEQAAKEEDYLYISRQAKKKLKAL